jgi:hypothetical protein
VCRTARATAITQKKIGLCLARVMRLLSDIRIIPAGPQGTRGVPPCSSTASRRGTCAAWPGAAAVVHRPCSSGDGRRPDQRRQRPLARLTLKAGSVAWSTGIHASRLCRRHFDRRSDETRMTLYVTGAFRVGPTTRVAAYVC